MQFDSVSLSDSYIVLSVFARLTLNNLVTSKRTDRVSNTANMPREMLSGSDNILTIVCILLRFLYM